MVPTMHQLIKTDRDYPPARGFSSYDPVVGPATRRQSASY